MLKVFRQKGVAKKVLWVVAGIIIISFGFGFGISHYGSEFNLNQRAGKVFGKTVSLKDYHRYSRDTHDQAVMMHGADIEKILPMMDMDNETWARIILIKAADQQGIKASDMEVIQFIATTGFFQRDGEFDKGLYANIVKNVFKREAREFEEGIRDQIRIMKIFTPQIKGITFTDEAVRQEYTHRNQKTQVDYTLVDPDTFSTGVTANEPEMRAYYTMHREEFLEPETVSAAVVTLALDAKASAGDKAKASAQADELFRKLSDGADIAATALEFKATVKDTGLFSMRMPSPELSSLDLLQQVFMGKAGEILKPVETPSGYQIVKITEKKPAFTPEFEKITGRIKDALIKEKATRLAADKAEELQKTIAEKLKNGADFMASVKELGLESKQTPFFGAGEYIPEIGLSDDFISAAFALNKNAPLSPVVLTPRGPVIIHWAATQPIDEKKFEEVKKTFSDSLYSEERVRIMNSIISDLRAKARLENDIARINDKQKAAMEKMRVKK